MSDRLREAFQREFKIKVAWIVEQAFAILRDLPDEIYEVEIPWIGGTFDPHVRQGRLVNSATDALVARGWVEQQVADPPLPLSVEDIEAMQTATCPALVCLAGIPNSCATPVGTSGDNLHLPSFTALTSWQALYRGYRLCRITRLTASLIDLTILNILKARSPICHAERPLFFTAFLICATVSVLFDPPLHSVPCGCSR